MAAGPDETADGGEPPKCGGGVGNLLNLTGGSCGVVIIDCGAGASIGKVAGGLNG